MGVSLCSGVIGPLLESDSRYQRELLIQFVLSSVAYTIAHLDADPVAINVSGLEGALAAYRMIAAQGGRLKR